MSSPMHISTTGADPNPTGIGPISAAEQMAEALQEASHQTNEIVEVQLGSDNARVTCPLSRLSRALVLDNGSQAVKFGYSGDASPISELLSVVGRIKYVPSCWFGGRGMKDVVVGAEVLQRQSLLHNRWPIQGSRIDDWDDLEALWWNVFYTELKVDPKEHPLLAMAPLGLSRKESERMTTMVFEYFECPEFFTSDSAPLALYATGRTTGLVVDSGHCRTAAVPVYEGFPLANAAQTLDIAGRDITRHLRSLLAESHPAITSKTDELTIRNVKEYCCYITENPYLAILNKRWEEQSYTLPDGKTMHLGTERFRAPEPMFSPLIGLPATVLRAIMRSDVKLRDELSQDIVLAGGNTLFPGFADRLQQGLSAMSPTGMKFSVVTPPDTKYSAWLGGSMLASLSTFRDICIRAEEYNEYGPVMMRRKCWGLGVASG
ncbi:Actin [Madurella fahalii]|uniref:Actin n=1 Tax=Madurella fahalii TaxID=1157608 RepID=A0ABQ0GT76_9PEZI